MATAAGQQDTVSQGLDREQHNVRLAAWLDAQEDGAPVDEVQVSRIAASAPLHVLPPTTGIPLRRALYLACGPHPAPLVQQLLRGGVDSVLGVDVSSSSVSRAAAALPAAVLGNTPGLTRFIVGDAQDVPPFQGPFSVAHLSAGALTHAHDDAADTLARTALLLAPGGHVVVGVLGGRAAADAASRAASSGCGIVTRPLPDQSTWQHLLAPLPLTLTSFTDDPDFYCAVLQVPPLYALPSGQLRIEAPVVRGFGRGSAALGIPTANLEPTEAFSQAARQSGAPAMRRGVYYGWARVMANDSDGVHGFVVKAVINVGKRPTFADGAGDTVEVHLMYDFGAGTQFYGTPVRVLLLGFMRPELQFSSLQHLLARIRTDIGQASALLDVESNKRLASDTWLVQ